MMQHRFLFPILVLAFMLPAQPGAAAGDATYSGAYTLEDVVVSTERDNQKVESVSMVREVTSEDIDVRDARTLDEAGFGPTNAQVSREPVCPAGRVRGQCRYFAARELVD